MGTNDAKSAPGANTPTNATIGPMIAASEYAGDVDASPITIELTKPIAPGLSVAAASGFSPGDCFAMVPSWSGPNWAVALLGWWTNGAGATPGSTATHPIARAASPDGVHTVTKRPHLRQWVSLRVRISVEGVVPCGCYLSGLAEWAGRSR